MLKNLLNKNKEEDKEVVEVEEETPQPVKESKAMKAVDALAPLYRKFDVDFDQMRFIVDTKMKMDARQENPIENAWNNGANKKERNSFFSSLWIYALISLFMVVMFVYDNYIFQYTAYFSYLFFMMLAILVAHFSNVLLDPKDQEQIGTKPVSAKTLGAAKATHIGMYLVAFSLAIGGPMMVASFLANGALMGILTVLLTLVAAIWCLFLTILVYAFVLRHFDGEKLKNMISYSQIGVSVFMIMGYHVMGDLFQVIDPDSFLVEMNLQWWHILVFPMWFVAPYGIIEEGFNGTFGVYLGLLLVGTIGLILLYRAYSDKIDRNLQKIHSDGSKGNKKSRLASFYAKVVCQIQERPYFHFAWQLTKHEREFKTRLYPSIASALIFPVIMMWTTITSGDFQAFEDLGWLAYTPYFVTMMVPMTSMTIRYSNNYKARWMFMIGPEKADTYIIRGVFKAMYMKLLLPVYGVTSVVVLFFTGMSTLPILINGLFILGIVFYVDMAITLNNVPFTQAYNASEANRGCLASIIFFIGALIGVGGLAFIQMAITPAIYILLVMLLVATIWIFTNGFKKKKFDPIMK
jgi:hypothetical protein